MDTLFDRASIVFDITCSFVFLIFLYKFIWHSQRNYPIKMMIALTILFLLCPISNLLSPYVTVTKTVTLFFECFRIFIFKFGLYWSSAVAILTYWILEAKSIFPFRPFIICAIIICVLGSSIVPLAYIFNYF